MIIGKKEKENWFLELNFWYIYVCCGIYNKELYINIYGYIDINILNKCINLFFDIYIFYK